MYVKIAQFMKCLLYKYKDPSYPRDMWKICLVKCAYNPSSWRQKQVDIVSW